MTARDAPYVSDRDVRRFYEQLMHLLEFTRDMDRNTDDAEFVRAGGTIHYVFDENVFEFFIGAQTYRAPRSGSGPGEFGLEDKRKYSALFHLDAWRDRRDDSSKEDLWIRINRQTAVIAAEYLLGGNLPGQVGHRLYLTEWHSRELRWRFQNAFRHFSDKLRRAATAAQRDGRPIHAIQREIDEILELAKSVGWKAEDLIAAAPMPGPDRAALDEDIGRLRRAEETFDDVALMKFASTRLVAQKLIEDDILEPLQQIRRVYSEDIAPRLYPLQLLEPRPTRADIGRQASGWKKDLTDEEDIRRIPKDERRGDGRLAVDASSLAHVQWMAERYEGTSNRIVLVTGDTLLFDTYRRRWSKNPSVPFVLRRITQYAPILNFKDAGSRVNFKDANDRVDPRAAEGRTDSGREIFDNTRRAVEPALMFFNLAEDRIRAGGARSGERRVVAEAADDRWAPDAHRLGAREDFALRLKEDDALKRPEIKAFADQIGSRIAASFSQGYVEIRDRWQEMERLAIGLFDKQLESRLDNDQRRRLRDISAGDGNFGAYINEGVLGELYEHNAVIFIPDAFRSLRRWLRPQGKHVTWRAPIAVRLAVALSPEAGASDLADLVDVLLGRDGPRVEAIFTILENGNWLREHPELLFAMASVVALRLALWGEAAKYADLAAGAESALKLKHHPELDQREDYYELVYLRAVATRFRIGDIPSGAADGEARSHSLLASAKADLAVCIAFHGNSSDGRQSLRELRALSERAASSLFYASWLLRAAEGVIINEVRTASELASAFDDLCTAAMILDLGRRRGHEFDRRFKTKEFSRFFAMVEEQIAVNTAACFVFAKLLERRGGPPMFGSPDNLEVFTRLRNELRGASGVGKWAQRSPEAIADLQAFLWLYESDQEALQVISQLAPGTLPGAVQMDSDLIRVYQRAFVPEATA